jgi:isoquinoline 1-oxidoreductase beta subunit
MLLATAAKRWGVDPQSLRTQAGQVIGPRGKKLGYGELADEAMKMPVPQQVKLKDAKDFRIIGHATGRLDARAKSSGRQSYGIDMHLPGMLTAVVAHPPVYGSKIQSVDDAAAKAIKGVRAVLRVPSVWGRAGCGAGRWLLASQAGSRCPENPVGQRAVGKVDSARQLAQYRELAKSRARSSLMPMFRH